MFILYETKYISIYLHNHNQISQGMFYCPIPFNAKNNVKDGTCKNFSDIFMLVLTSGKLLLNN